MLNVLSNVSYKLKAIYLLWFLANLILLLMNNSIQDIFFGGNNIFIPIEDYELEYYDMSEFLAYTITPVIIYASVKLFFKKNNQINEDSSKI